jgi:hypothetical protein
LTDPLDGIDQTRWERRWKIAREPAVVGESIVDEGLPERQREILDFERQWWRRAGAKEQAIRDQFDLSPTRYYQQLNTLLDQPAALAYDPATVRRLRRLRSARDRTRGASSSGDGSASGSGAG